MSIITGSGYLSFIIPGSICAYVYSTNFPPLIKNVKKSCYNGKKAWRKHTSVFTSVTSSKDRINWIVILFTCWYWDYKMKYKFFFSFFIWHWVPKNLGISYVMRTVKLFSAVWSRWFWKDPHNPEWALIAKERTTYRRVEIFIAILPVVF